MKEDRYIVTAEWDDGDAGDEKGFEVVDYCETKADALMTAIGWARANFADYSRAWNSWARVMLAPLRSAAWAEKSGISGSSTWTV